MPIGNFSSNMPLLALLTDFGLEEPYVGQLKGNIIRHCPQAAIIDISHEVPAFNIRIGAYFLEATAEYFPQHTVFLGVIDPGVGSSRDLIALETGGKIFIGPNNGLFCLIRQEEPTRLWKFFRLESMNNSSVFAGRDIAAPLAGKILSGTPLETVAESVDLSELVRVQWEHAKLTSGMIKAEVLHVDRFGNIVLNLTCKQWNLLKPQKTMLLKTAYKEFPLFSAEYYTQIPSNTLAILPGSQGYMEISMNQSKACQLLEISANSGNKTAIDIIY